jgi:ankyrin repeat domain-containing protein 13
MYNSTEYVLHKLIFQKEFPTLLKVFQGMKTKIMEIIDLKDLQGNTPLLLAGKLCHGDQEYLKCVNFLFRSGANGKVRDSNGWSLMDEAISQQNPRLLAIVFDCLNIKKKEKIEKNKLKVLSRLELIPDFYMEVSWECHSSWIPFLSRIAPSDRF